MVKLTEIHNVSVLTQVSWFQGTLVQQWRWKKGSDGTCGDLGLVSVCNRWCGFSNILV